MNGILAKKLGMTQVFTEQGECVPVTVLEAGPCVVVCHKTEEKDGYTAVQIGFGLKKEQRANKAEVGHFKKADVAVRESSATVSIAVLVPMVRTICANRVVRPLTPIRVVFSRVSVWLVNTATRK